MSTGALHLCYLPVHEPLVQTQVVPYLRGLAEAGHRIHLLTFDTGPADPAMRTALRAQGIWWHHARYHHHPRLAATAFDVLVGVLLALFICSRYELRVVHARSHVPAVIAMLLRVVLGNRRLVFDVRGLVAEEYADAGVWRAGGLGFRITKAIERQALRRADAVVVLTERLRERLVEQTGRTDIVTIPCCADVGAIAAFHERRELVRDRFGIRDRPVLLYVGKFGGSCMEDETIELYRAGRAVLDGLFFLVSTQSDHAQLARRFAERGLDGDDFRIVRVAPDEIGEVLAAADLGVALIRPSPSTIAASPTKIGEYLAGGLPVIVTAGIGDVDDLVRESGTGVLVADTSADGLREAARSAVALTDDPAIPARCRATADARLSLHGIGIPRYRALYASLASDG